MRHLRAFVVLSCLACVRHPVPTVPPDPVELAPRLLASSARVMVECFNGQRWMGSGVAVSPRHILTAKHVLTSCGLKIGTMVLWTQEPKLVTVHYQGHVYEVTEDARSEWYDAILLVAVGVGRPFGTHAEVRDVGPMRGEGVCDVVYETGADGEIAREMRCGRIVSSDGRKVKVDFPTIRGNSGGPVFDAYGRVVALVVQIDGGSLGSDAWRDLVPPPPMPDLMADQ